MRDILHHTNLQEESYPDTPFTLRLIIIKLRCNNTLIPAQTQNESNTDTKGTILLLNEQLHHQGKPRTLPKSDGNTVWGDLFIALLRWTLKRFNGLELKLYRSYLASLSSTYRPSQSS